MFMCLLIIYPSVENTIMERTLKWIFLGRSQSENEITLVYPMHIYTHWLYKTHLHSENIHNTYRHPHSHAQKHFLEHLPNKE